MSVSRWIKSVMFPVETSEAAEPSSSEARNSGGAAPMRRPDPPLPQREPSKRAQAQLLRPKVGFLDREEPPDAKALESDEEDVLRALRGRVESGAVGVQELPSSSVKTLELANRPSIELKELVDSIGRDPGLASEMLRIANSALYATQNPANSVQQAAMRIGLNNVRGVVFTAAMKNALRGVRRLEAFGDEVWRQTQSVALLARVIGGRSGFEPEQAYLIGLLHDIGKLVLLGLLEGETKELGRPTSTLVSRAFREHHELAGAALAKAWKLPEELTAVAGSHHDLTAELAYPRETALAWLAHEVDLRLSLGDDAGCRALAESKALELLGVTSEEERWELIEVARRVWEAHDDTARG